HPVFQDWYLRPSPSRKDVLDFLKGAWGKTLAVDTETTGLRVVKGYDHATGVSVAYRDTDSGRIVAHYFPFRHKGPGNYPDEYLGWLRQLLVDGAQEIVFHNGKFDLASLRTLDIDVTANWFDTGVMAHLINENFPLKKDLDTLLRVYLGPHKQKAKTLELDMVTQTYGWANVPAEMMRHYATMDAHLTLELFECLR